MTNEFGFTRYNPDRCVFVLRGEDGELPTAGLVFVDDLMVFGPRKQEVRDWIFSKWKWRDLGRLADFLGAQLRYVRDVSGRKVIELHMERYVQKLAEKYQISTKGVSRPLERKLCDAILAPQEQHVPGGTAKLRELLGTIGYAVVMCRPDCAYAQSHFQRMVEVPTEDVMAALRHYCKYVAGTEHAKLVYRQLDAGESFSLSATADADWKGCWATGKSTGGHMVMMNGMIIGWKSKLLPGSTKMSSSEAEFIECGLCFRDTLFFKHLHTFVMGNGALGLDSAPIPVEQDNKGSKDTCEGASGSGLRHLDHHEFFARDKVEDGEFRVVKVDTTQISSDALTKPMKTGLEVERKFGKYNFRV
eukprot:gene337-131_t